MTEAEKTAEEKKAEAAAKKAEAAAAKKAEAAAAKKAEAAEKAKAEAAAAEKAKAEAAAIEGLGEALVSTDNGAKKAGLDAAESIAKSLLSTDENTSEVETPEIAPNIEIKPIKRKVLRVTNASSSQLRCFVSDLIIPALGQIDIHYDTAEELQRAKDSFDKTNEISATKRLGYEDLGDV